MRHRFYREYRKALDLVVVTRVVAKRTFVSLVVGVEMPFQHDFGACRNFEVGQYRPRYFRFRPAQKPGKGILRERIRYRRYRCQYGGRIATQHHGNRKRCVAMLRAPFLVVERASAVR